MLYTPNHEHEKRSDVFYFFYISSKMVIFFLHNNAWLHVARMRLQKLTDLEYETLPNPSYYSSLSTTHYRVLGHFFTNIKIKISSKEVETAFEDFISIKTSRVFIIQA